MSFKLNNYLVEFETEEGQEQEFVMAEDEYEAIHSIEIGWPEASILAVYKQVWCPEEDEDGRC